jgi:hypothetical protein
VNPYLHLTQAYRGCDVDKTLVEANKNTHKKSHIMVLTSTNKRFADAVPSLRRRHTWFSFKSEIGHKQLTRLFIIDSASMVYGCGKLSIYM